MPFQTIKQFQKSFPSIKNLTPEQKQKALDIFNALIKDGTEEARAIAIAISKVKKIKEQNLSDFFVAPLLLLEENEDKSTIEILRVGTIQGRGLKITQKTIAELAEHFDEQVYGQEIPVHATHKERGGEAVGWLSNLFVKDNKLMAEIEWTESGKDKINKKLYKYVSAEYGKINHHLTGEPIPNTLIGLAFTNTPALKDQEALSLSELIINKTQMLKEFVKLLKEKAIVSKSEKETFKTLLEEAPEEVKSEIPEKEIKEIEDKPEEEAKKEEPKKKEEEKEEEKLEEEKVENVSLEEHNELKEKLEKMELSETFEKELMLSEDNSGFVEENKADVVSFMVNLSEEQRETFKEIVSQIKPSSIFGERGSDKAEKKATGDKEDQVVALAEKYEKEGLSLEDAQNKAYSEIFKN